MNETKTLEEYLKFKPKCPFCDKELETTIDNHDHSGDNFISNFENHKEYLQFNLRTILLKNDKINFKIKIYPNNKVKYSVVEKAEGTSVVFDQQFYDIFNLAYIYLDNSCVEKTCKVKYFINSSVLMTSNKRVKSFAPYIESITYGKFLVRNNFRHNKMQIYLDGSSAEPIETKFFKLTKETAPNIFNRIKIATVFA